VTRNDKRLYCVSIENRIFIFLLVIILLLTASGYQAIPAKSEAADTHQIESFYFTADELEGLRLLRTQPSHSTIWSNIASWANAHINDAPPDQPAESDSLATVRAQYWLEGERARQFIETIGFMYAMTEDTVYADAAKRWMLSISGWSEWEPAETFGLVTSVFARAFAFGYDILHDYLSESERETIRDAMVSNISPVYSRIRAANHWTINLQTVSTGGVGLVGLALEDDYDEATTWLNCAVANVKNILNYVDEDGGWYEGPGYALASLSALVPFLDAYNRVKGVDLFDNDFLRNHAYYYIYLLYDGQHLIPFEDYEVVEGWHIDEADRGSFLYRLASEYNDGYAQTLADTFASQVEMRTFIWKNPDIVPAPYTDLPLSRHFRGLGYVIFRTGWGSNDLIFAFKSGTSEGHAHPSQNEFGIYYRGKPLTCGAGHTYGQPEDNTWSHNCMLVNGDGQEQEPIETRDLGLWGQILAYEIHEPYYTYVLGDASAPYSGKLDWLRHVVFVKNPNCFVMYDKVEAPSDSQFEWLLHAKRVQTAWDSPLESCVLSVDGDKITIMKDGVSLETLVLEPEDFVYSIEHFKYANWYVHDYDYIKVAPSNLATKAEFLTVHFPLTEDGSALPTEKVSVGNAIGAKIVDGDNLYLILFSTDGNPVNEYVELGESYKAADGGSYIFEGTGIRAQFDSYQVMRLRKLLNVTQLIIVYATLLIIIAVTVFLILLRRRRMLRRSRQI
jgi:hypothetical protein